MSKENLLTEITALETKAEKLTSFLKEVLDENKVDDASVVKANELSDIIGLLTEKYVLLQSI